VLLTTTGGAPDKVGPVNQKKLGVLMDAISDCKVVMLVVLVFMLSCKDAISDWAVLRSLTLFTIRVNSVIFNKLYYVGKKTSEFFGGINNQGLMRL